MPETETQHQQVFEGGFGKFLQSGQHADAVVVHKGKEYHVHRLIMAYSSEFFARTFLSEFKESTDQRIALSFEDPADVFDTVLGYMYSGSLELTVDNVVPLLSMADAFMMESLRELAMEYLRTNVTRHNVAEYFQVAVMYGAREAFSFMEQMVVKNFHFLVEKDLSFLPVDVYHAILADPDLAVRTEYSVFKNVVSYCETNAGSLAEDTHARLFNTVRFPWMGYKHLEEAQACPLVPKNLLVEGLMARLRRHEAPKDGDAQAPTEHNRRLQRRPPYSILFTYKSDYDGNGIVSWIATESGTRPWENPAISGEIVMTASSIEVGSAESILDPEPAECWTKDVPASWFAIDMGEHRQIRPNYYTLRHGGNYKADSLRNWDLQGSLDGNTWAVLVRHVQDTSLSGKFAVMSWPVKCDIAYRHFRILQTGHSSSKHNFLLVSGLELYGDLYEHRAPE